VQVAITCRHGDIPQEIRDQITQKVEKLLNYFERVTSIEVTIDFEGDRVTTEIIVDAESIFDLLTLKAPYGSVLTLEISGDGSAELADGLEALFDRNFEPE